MMTYGARIQLSIFKQIGLVSADLFRTELIGRAMKVTGKGLHYFQVAFHRSLRAITTLEFPQHHFSKLGHRDLLVTHTLRPQKS